MEKSQKESERVVTEADVDWAYGVLSKLREAMDKAGGDAVVSKQLMGEICSEMPDVFEAFIILVAEEHRPIVGQAMTSWVRWVKSWQAK